MYTITIKGRTASRNYRNQVRSVEDSIGEDRGGYDGRMKPAESSVLPFKVKGGHVVMRKKQKTLTVHEYFGPRPMPGRRIEVI